MIIKLVWATYLAAAVRHPGACGGVLRVAKITWEKKPWLLKLAAARAMLKCRDGGVCVDFWPVSL